MNAKEENGQVALIVAVSNGHAEVAQVLLQAGADLNTSDKNGETALMKATARGRAKVAEILKKSGAKE